MFLKLIPYYTNSVYIATWTQIVFLKWVPYYTHTHCIHISMGMEIVFLKRVPYYTHTLYALPHRRELCFKKRVLLITHLCVCATLAEYTILVQLWNRVFKTWFHFFEIITEIVSWTHNFQGCVYGCVQQALNLLKHNFN